MGVHWYTVHTKSRHKAVAVLKVYPNPTPLKCMLSGLENS